MNRKIRNHREEKKSNLLFFIDPAGVSQGENSNTVHRQGILIMEV